VHSYTVEVPADASGAYTFGDGSYYVFEGMTAVATILGDTALTVGAAAPTLVTYTITNATITPPQTTSIDVRFSEPVSAIIKIEDASGNLVNELYTSSSVTNPDPQIWDGTDTSGTTVPDAIYTVNVSGVSTTTGLGVIDTSKTITVIGVTPTLASITISPASCALGVGGTQTFAAVCTDTSGNGMTCPTLTWTSTDETVGMITSAGVFTASAAGATTITSLQVQIL
jgi:hypothetical protein